MSERMGKLMRLREAMTQSVDVRHAVHAIVVSHGVKSIGHLSEEKPEVFDEVADGLLDMVEELPWA